MIDRGWARCGGCAEHIRVGLLRCRHCGTPFLGPRATPPAVPTVDDGPLMAPAADGTICGTGIAFEIRTD